MIKIKIALVDEHESYLEKLTDALRKKYSNQLEIRSFSSLNLAMKSISETSYDLLLVDGGLANESFGSTHGAELVYLSSKKDVVAICGRPAIFKHQAVDLIFKAIVSASSRSLENVSTKKAEGIQSQVITFFPSSGGVGASTLAAACALSAAKRNIKVCYLNLELFGSSERFFQAPGDMGLDAAFLAIKTKKTNLPLRFQGMIKKYPPNLFFVDSCNDPHDIAEIREDEFETLVSALSQAGGFQLLVLDMDFAWSPLAMAAMRMSDIAVFVSNGTEAANSKFVKIFNTLRTGEFLGSAISTANVAIMYNAFSSKHGIRLDSSIVPVVGGVRRIECESTWELVDALSSDACFNGLFSGGR